MFSYAFLATVLAAVACAKPVARSMQVHESRTDVPSAFVLKGPAAPDTMLNMRRERIRMAPRGSVVFVTPLALHYALNRLGVVKCRI